MAIWQINLNLVSNKCPAPNSSLGGASAGSLCDREIVLAAQFLRDTLGAPRANTDSATHELWNVGAATAISIDEVASRITICYDIRNTDASVVALLCRLAVELDCVFYSPETGRIAQPNADSIAWELHFSHVAATMRDLKLSHLAPGGSLH